MTSNGFMCPVCGYPGLREPARLPSGGGSYEICPSCGFEFGVSDDDQGFTYDQWRQRWIGDGASWWGAQDPPDGWDAKQQLAGLRRVEPEPRESGG